MQKVISINLNGHACQLEEGGYEALRDYLAGAARDLASNPDRDEIIADLEQAIADRCAAFLGPHKSVVTEGEVRQIVAEMGPVDAPPPAGAGADAASAAPDGAGGASAAPRQKRLYAIREGAMIGGICNGLAAYFALDVTLVRVGFVLSAFLTQGLAILAYVLMMFIVPEAKTPEERAAAGSATFNARDIVDRAKQQAAAGAKQMRRSWRRQQRQWRRYGGAAGARAAYAPPGLAGVLLPVFSLAHFVLFFAAVAVLVSLVNHERVFGWELDPDVPLWAAVLILLVAYQILVSPFRAVEKWAEAQPEWHAFWGAVVWLVTLAFLFWFASNHLPEIREFVDRVPEVVRDFVDDVRGWMSVR